MTTLGESATITDCEHKTAPRAKPDDRFAWSIGTKAIRDGRIDYDQARPVDEPTYVVFSARRAPAYGDLILAREAPVGDAVLVPRLEPVCLGQRTVLVTPDVGVLDFRYLYYWLRSPETQAWMRIHSEGSTVKHLNVSDIHKVPLGTLPDLSVQKRIASVLGTFDDLIETNRQLIRDLDELSFALSRRLAQDAPTISFEEMADRVADRTTPRSCADSTPYLGLEHFSVDGKGLAGRGTAAEVQSASLRFSTGDVLYGKLRPYFRKVARPGFSGICSAEIWVLRPRPGHPHCALHAVVQSPEFSATAMAGNSGTKMPRADWDHISRMQVPDLRAVLSTSEKEGLEQFWQAACELRDEVDLLVGQRDALLPLLMSGRVRVSNEEGVD